LGTPASGVVTNLTGTASININGTVGATTASTGAFTTLAYTGTLTGGTGVINIGSGQLYKDASGNVGIGTSSPAQGRVQFNVVNAGAGDISAVALNLTNDSTSAGTGVSLRFSPGNVLTVLRGSYINSVISGTNGSDLQFWTCVSGFAPAERARIDSAGNVGIGTSSPSFKLDIRGGNASTVQFNNDGSQYTQVRWSNNGTGKADINWDNTNNLFTVGTIVSSPMAFLTNGLERARITSGGYFKASFDGSYNNLTGTFHEFTGTTANGYTLRTRCTNASPASHYISELIFTAASPNNTGALFIECRDSTAARIKLSSNGGIANYSANDVNLSDRREKTNFAPAKNYLETICAIPVQTFNYIDQNMEDDGGLTLGVVAQDVQSVAPELVMESNWGTQEDPKMRLSVYQTDLQYALMKALQELKAEFDAYKASHP
jgi:hypothetical protein